MNRFDIVWAIVMGLFWYDTYKDIKEKSRPSATLCFAVVITGAMIFSVFS